MFQGNLPQQLWNAWPYFQSAGIDPVEINNGGQYGQYGQLRSACELFTFKISYYFAKFK